MADRPAADEIRAAGAVAWRPGPDGPQVALVHRPKYDDWTLPKGKTEPGEHVLLTAVREIDGGDRPARDARPPAPPVLLRRRRPAQAGRLLGRPGRRTRPAEFVPNHEVDELAWLSVRRRRPAG